jgi:small conductance mechanosensitive channel
MQLPVEMTSSGLGLLVAADPLGLANEMEVTLFGTPVEYFKLHSPELLGGIAVLVIGYFLSRWVGAIVARTLQRQSLEPPVRLLMVRVSRLLVLALALVIALDTAGFKMTALITGAGVVGVGLGFGMQGLLSNVVAGLAIIFTKPFRVGEYIGILGVQGLVGHIDLVSTTLQHEDGSLVVIPNHKIIGEILQNYGTTRQLNLAVGVGYTADLNKVQALVMEILGANSRVLKNPAPQVTIDKLGDCAINLSIKPWVKLADVVPAQTEINAAIIERFRAGGIEIPFPLQEIRILNPAQGQAPK